jgi:hypothetical protein
LYLLNNKIPNVIIIVMMINTIVDKKDNSLSSESDSAPHTKSEDKNAKRFLGKLRGNGWPLFFISKYAIASPIRTDGNAKAIPLTTDIINIWSLSL